MAVPPPKRFATAASLRASLEDRLKREAAARGVPLNTLRVRPAKPAGPAAGEAGPAAGPLPRHPLTRREMEAARSAAWCSTRPSRGTGTPGPRCWVP